MCVGSMWYIYIGYIGGPIVVEVCNIYHVRFSEVVLSMYIIQKVSYDPCRIFFLSVKPTYVYFVSWWLPRLRSNKL